MELKYHVEPITLERVVVIRISDYELGQAYRKFSRAERRRVNELARDDASIEEKLMLLQLYAKVLEQEAANVR